jgi:hypothetical protein
MRAIGPQNMACIGSLVSAFSSGNNEIDMLEVFSRATSVLLGVNSSMRSRASALCSADRM